LANDGGDNFDKSVSFVSNGASCRSNWPLGVMTDRISVLAAFLTDVERLKLVERKAYVSGMSRRENSAEHSWHLSLGLLAIAQELNFKIDLHKALVMALIHDVCEVDAGDTPAFGPQRLDQHGGGAAMH
jgi:putative hydrolase of HD superfamily